YRFTKQLFTAIDPFLDAGRRNLRFGERPEPQRAPSVHHPSQALIRSIRVRELRFNLSTGHRRPWSGLLETPHADGPSGLGLSDGQTLECVCLEHVCMYRGVD